MAGGGINWKKAFILAGALIALVIGSGFATGQEIMQYFSAYGVQGMLALLVFAVAFVYYNYNFAKVGAEQRYEVGNDVYKYYCGRHLGAFFDYYSTAFCYMSFFVMVGGAASTLNQGFGVPTWIGGLLLTAIVVLIVCLGLNKLVDIIGVIGPIKIAFFIAVGAIVLALDWSQIPAGLAAISTGELAGAAEGEGITQAGDNWLASGLSYAGFVLLWFASFTTLLGSNNERRDLNAGIVIATVVICAAIAIITFAQIANVNTSVDGGQTYVWNAAIPNLILAGRLWSGLSYVYAVIVFIGICATAVPLLYNPVARFAKEGTPRFRALAIALGVAGLLIGLYVPYATLVNVIYVLNGYVGAVLIVFMLWRNIQDIRVRRAAAAAGETQVEGEDAGAQVAGVPADEDPAFEKPCEEAVEFVEELEERAERGDGGEGAGGKTP